MKMKAIFVTGGKQYYVSEGETIYVEKLDKEVGSEV
jgi:ribosomal protein L21